MSRLVNVSNRVASPRKGMAVGGLAVGILQAMQARGGLWFGWSGQTTADTPASKPSLTRRGDIQYATLDLQADEFALFYGGFCNSTLWPLCHYFLDTFRYSDEEFDAYLAVNRRLAESLRPLLQQDDVVWVHDYQLIPLGARLRARCLAPDGVLPPRAVQHRALRALPVYASSCSRCS